MKKTQRKDAVRNIRSRIVSYLSICLVTMLGLGGFFITCYMGAGINAKGTEYYNDHAFKNFELISSLGITEDDIAQIKEVEGITDAEGVIRVDGSLRNGGEKRNVEIISMTERISVPEVVDGRAPAAKDECMIGEDFSAISGIKVGDRVSLMMPEIESSLSASEDSSFSMDEDTEEESEEKGEKEKKALEEKKDSVLRCKEFTVTGLMRHPDYLRRKSINTVALPWAAYDTDVTEGFFTHVFVLSEEPEGVDIFKNKYFEETAGTKKKLEDLTEVLAEDSAKRAKNKAYARIDEEWQKAQAKLGEAQEEIDDSEASLNAGLADARKELADAQKELDSKVGDANKKIKAGEEKIKKGEKELKNGEKKIKEGEKQLKEAKENLKLIDDKLPEAKKYIEDMKAKYDGDLKDDLTAITMAQKFLDKLKKVDPESEEFKMVAKMLAGYILDNQDKIRKVHDFFSDDDLMKNAEKIKDVTKVDATDTVKEIKSFDVEGLIALAEAVYNGNGDILGFINMAQEFIDSTRKALDQINEIDKYIKEYEENRDDIYKKVSGKEKELKDGKKQLAAGKKELAAAKKQLAAAKKELASEKKKYQAKIRNGWSLYYSQKAEYEQKLEEAKALLAENREAAEEKLEEARAEVDKIESKWILLDRRGNAGYVDMKSNVAAVDSIGLAFGLLFILISSIVCFSTLAIIIDEQKKMVGTVKAFGFHKGEVLGKYLVFGVTASITGIIGGILVALGLSDFVLKKYHESGMYQFDCPDSVITPSSTIIACVCMIIVCALATVIACTDILKSPASILMKGGKSSENENRKNGKSSKSKTASGRGGSLYSRLIVRNMLEDKVRVLISIAIIAFSTMLVGTGISMKLAYDGMTDKQVSDVFKYDIKVDLGDKVTDEQRAAIAGVLAEGGAEYTLASYETHLYRWDDKLDALYVLTGNPDEIQDYFAINDPKTGKALTLPDDGVLIQKKMKESYDMTVGTAVPLMDSGLDLKDAEVRGYFQNYVGRLMVTSPEGYRHIFGEEPSYNCYYVRANGADIQKMESDLLEVTEDVSFDEAGSFASKFEAVSLLYNIIVYVTTGIAILMSFMILTNLSNIFLNRRKTELTVMRINGFSIKQTKGYLVRETVVTTAIGVIAGVLLGAVVAPIVIRLVEQPDLQFIRTFHPTAWIIAVAMEVVFSVIINSLVFRKVKDLNFRDVA